MMSRIVPIRAGLLTSDASLRLPLTWRDVLSIIGVAAISVGGSVGLTLVQIGWDSSALTTASVIPLLVSVPVATYLVRQRSRIAALNAQLNELVRRDPLTGLLNRRAFIDGVERAGPGALILIDADRFKAINDTWGHPAGDSVLTEIASRLGATAGPMALVGRLGGEEFAVFSPGLGKAAAIILAEKLRATIADRPVTHDRVAIGCTISLGLCLVGPDEASLPEALTRADAALYKAKAQGRDRVSLAEAPADLRRTA